MMKFTGIKKSIIQFVTVSASISLISISVAAPPAGYYNSANGLSGSQLKSALHNIIDDHQRYPYTSSATDTWDILADADEDPSNSSKIITIYSNESVTSSDHSQSTGWNREHTWPKSYGFPTDNSCNYPYTDIHMLMAADWGYNSARNNRIFDLCTSGCTSYIAYGTSYYNYGSGSGNTGAWEVWEDRKGDIARAMFYMDVRYEGGTHGITSCSEPNLILTDNTSLIQTSSSNQSTGYMGKLSVLLAWHIADPVSLEEEQRNEVVYSYQGNRNPFIDNPDWVCDVYGISGCSTSTQSSVWINEFHYDNSGTDTGEFVEVAGTAGTDLSGWKVLGYNGSNGAVYKTVSLSGTIANQSNGFGTKSFTFSGMQNGAPDGLALVDDSNNVIEFISYEGSFSATSGAASGMTSTDIGKSETTSTPVGYSLQRVGTGSEGDDFSWASPKTDTPGAKNSGQTFQ